LRLVSEFAGANKRFQQKAPPVCGMLGLQRIWGRRFS